MAVTDPSDVPTNDISELDRSYESDEISLASTESQIPQDYSVPGYLGRFGYLSALGQVDLRDIPRSRGHLYSGSKRGSRDNPSSRSDLGSPCHLSSLSELGLPDISSLRGDPDSRGSSWFLIFANLISGLLVYLGISITVYDLLDFVSPRVPPGLTRVHWRCSCNTIMWGDFPNDTLILDELKKDLSQASIASEQASVYAFTNRSLPPDILTRAATGASSQPLEETGDKIISIELKPKYFQVCIDVGSYAIEHYELDISNTSSDGELFKQIWEKYKTSRGYGMRRLFLRPKYVNFVRFSVNKNDVHGTGIHETNAFPPEVEVKQHRYHYLIPKVMMPTNVFLHYLHRAQWNIWSEHSEDVWLKRLPKKLNTALIPSEEAQANSDLFFGWGVHIINGPNHFALGLLLAIGIGITLAISLVIFGVYKTQEQAFGVGSYLLAIIACIMASFYFKLTE